MYLCYMDESGTSEIPGNTSHFILVGLSIPVWHWKDCDKETQIIKKKYAIESSEIHVAWILRKYLEQSKILDFDSLDYPQRRSKVQSLRTDELLRLQRTNVRQYKQTKKNFRETESYMHLNYAERQQLAKELAQCISKWGFARLFAECVDKTYFDPTRSPQTIDEQSFGQIVSRFEQYLQIISSGKSEPYYGLLIHDNNETVAKHHTDLMKKFYRTGALSIQVKNIIETPLFVDSQLTSMVQLADVCAYSLRRYLENKEEELFDYIFQRADRKDGIVVGVRHFANRSCNCKICSARKKPESP